MMPTQIKHIFFDLDDTLWDFKRNSFLTFEKVFKNRNLPIVMSDFMEVYRPINERYWKLYREDKIDRDTLRFNRLTESLEVLGFSCSKETIHGMVEDYIVYLADFNHLLPDTLPILNYLKDKYRLHILTNGFEIIQHRKLQNSQIHSFFDTVTASDEVGVKKPHPYIFEKALAKAKALKENSLMIGDSLEADIEGAHQFGLKAIFFQPEGLSDYQGQSIRALSELKNFL